MKSLLLLAIGAGAAAYFLSKKSSGDAPSTGASGDAPKLKGSEIGPIAFAFDDPKFTAAVADKVRQAVQLDHLIDGGKNIKFFVQRPLDIHKYDPKAEVKAPQKYFTQIVPFRTTDNNPEFANVLLDATITHDNPNKRIIYIIPASAANKLETTLRQIKDNMPAMMTKARERGAESNLAKACSLLKRTAFVGLPVRNGTYFLDELGKNEILRIINGGEVGFDLCGQRGQA